MEQGTRQAKETEYDKQRLCHTKRKQENIKQRCKRPKQSKTRQSKREREREIEWERKEKRKKSFFCAANGAGAGAARRTVKGIRLPAPIV